MVNAYAAEHLEIHTADAAAVAARVRNAGAIFVGPFAPVSLGDYCAGSNHVLPTAGCACHSSGLSVRAFLKAVHVVEYSRDALRRGRRPRASRSPTPRTCRATARPSGSGSSEAVTPMTLAAPARGAARRRAVRRAAARRPGALNVNENPYPPSAGASSPTSPPRSPRPRATLNRYPDREFTELRKALADYLGHGGHGIGPTRSGRPTAPTR